MGLRRCPAIIGGSPRTLDRWIGRFNEYGIDGLTHDVERIEGRVLKTWWFNNHQCNTHEELAARVDLGLRSFFDSPQIVRSICGQA